MILSIADGRVQCPARLVGQQTDTPELRNIKVIFTKQTVFFVNVPTFGAAQIWNACLAPSTKKFCGHLSLVHVQEHAELSYHCQFGCQFYMFSHSKGGLRSGSKTTPRTADGNIQCKCTSCRYSSRVYGGDIVVQQAKQ